MSNETRWTPGPWIAYPNQDENLFYIAQQDGAPYTPGYSDVCGLSCHTWDGERFTVQQANAHLVAAAPELYEALDMLMESTGPGDAAHLLAEERANIMALLAKARGEQS